MATALEQYIAIDTIIRDVLHANVCLCQAADTEWEWYSLLETRLAQAEVDPSVVVEALKKMHNSYADDLLRYVQKGVKAPGKVCVPTREFLTTVAQVLERK